MRTFVRTVATVLVVGITAAGLSATPAWAGNSSTNRCLTAYVEYEAINATARRVHWVESRNACSAWRGHFQTHGQNGPEGNPVQTHRVSLGGQIVYVNERKCYGGIAWAYDNGSYLNIGETCALVV